MKIRVLYIGILLGLNFQSCIKPDIIPPEAEITEIYDITETSAIFTVNVTSESNSEWDEAFLILIDTLPLTETSIAAIDVSIAPEAKIGIYTISVVGLVSNTHYYSRIYYRGIFDIGGPNDEKRFLIGEEKEFTTLPFKK